MGNNKVVHFSEEFSMNEINTVMKGRDEVIYYTRYIAEKNEFHIVRYKDSEIIITPFMTQLFNYYKNNEGLSNLISDSKIKGNDNFSIILNPSTELITQIKKDLNVLLKK